MRLALLKGVRILELGSQLSGPYAAMLLGDIGADVIKVEGPSRLDSAREVPCTEVGGVGTYFLSLNRNKRSILLDLKTEKDRRDFLELVTTVDVVLDNFRPGTMKRLGLDHPVLAAKNPGIVTCSLSGFGSTGPLRARPAYDYIIQALAGTMALTGEPDGPPTKYGISVVDHVGGLFAALSISSALLSQAKDWRPEGIHLDLSLLDTHISLLTYLATDVLNGGTEPERQARSAHPRNVPSQLFPTADGWLVVMPLANHFFRPFCNALGRPEWAEDRRYETPEGRLEHREELVTSITEVMLKRTTEYWDDRFLTFGVPAARVQGVSEALNMRQVQERGMVVSIEHETYGRYLGVDNPIAVTGDDGALSDVDGHLPPPLPGEHTEEILSRIRSG